MLGCSKKRQFFYVGATINRDPTVRGKKEKERKKEGGKRKRKRARRREEKEREKEKKRERGRKEERGRRRRGKGKEREKEKEALSFQKKSSSASTNCPRLAVQTTRLGVSGPPVWGETSFSFYLSVLISVMSETWYLIQSIV